MSRPDVPSSALVRKAGSLHPDAARLRYIVLRAPIGGRGRCQVCNEGDGQPLVVLEPIIDRDNGQRITIALCCTCARYAGLVADHTIPPPTGKRGRR